MKNYQAYIFDLDGTIVDSEKIKGKALVDNCKLFGADVHVNTYKSAMGRSWVHVVDWFFKEAKINPDIEKFNRKEFLEALPRGFRLRKIYLDLLISDLRPNLNIVNNLNYLMANNKKIRFS